MDNLKELFAQYVSEEVLTEDNLTKIEVMFESAINEAVKVKTEELDVVFEEKLRVEMESFQETVNEGLDDYLTLFVEEFTTENKIALTNKLMVEKAQTILSSIQTVFVENGIQIPESNDSLLTEMNDKFEDMESKYNEVQSEKIELSKQVIEMEKASAFINAVDGLVETDKEKIMNLMEGLVVDNVEDFKSKLSILVEKVADDDEDEDDEDKKDKKKKSAKKDEDEVNDDDEDVKKESDDNWSKKYQNMKLN